MDGYISKVLDQRFATRHERKKEKLVIDLALETYLKEQTNTNIEHAETLDPTFKRIAVNQIKMFIFAGHDTTSATICYAYHLLSRNPETLAKIRAEHDSVFGKNAEETAEKICDDPLLLNQLPYTVAVIKETLRLYPPASTVRKGLPG
jgi:cytochrome P450